MLSFVQNSWNRVLNFSNKRFLKNDGCGKSVRRDALSLAPPLLYWKGDYLSPGRTHTRHPLFMHLSLSLTPSGSFPIAYLPLTRTLTRYPLDSTSCPKAQTDLVTLTQGAWPQTRIRPP